MKVHFPPKPSDLPCNTSDVGHNAKRGAYSHFQQILQAKPHPDDHRGHHSDERYPSPKWFSYHP